MTPVGAVRTKENRGGKGQRDGVGRRPVQIAGLRARFDVLDPIHVHDMGPQRMNAASQRPDIRQYLDRMSDVVQLPACTTGGVDIRLGHALQRGDMHGADEIEICPEFRQFAGLLNLVEFVAGAFPVKTPVVPAFSPQQTLSAHLLYWTTAAGFAFMWWCDYKAYPKAQMRYSGLPGVPVRPAWESPGIGRIGLERQLQ